MKIRDKDITDTARVVRIINKINTPDRDFIDSESDEIYNSQPFLISMILGYRVDLKGNECEEIARIILIIWLYFKDDQKVKHNKITEAQYDKMYLKNAQMLNYYDGEPANEERQRIISSDLEHLNSRALWTGVFSRFHTENDLVQLNDDIKVGLLLAMKSLIECFEEIEHA